MGGVGIPEYENMVNDSGLMSAILMILRDEEDLESCRVTYNRFKNAGGIERIQTRFDKNT